jgi:glutathione S-transferase
MSHLKPIAVWSLGYSPNPWKVVIVFEELGLPYEIKKIGMAELKQEPYLSLNPNGRVPTIEDPNTGVTLWEVCAKGPFVSLLVLY